MNLLQRLKYAIESDFNMQLASDNPLARLNQYIQEAERQTEDTKTFLERQVKLKQHLETQLAEAKSLLEKRTTQITLAEQTGEADLIAFAQAEQEAYTNRVQLLTQSVHETTKSVIALEQKYELMKHKIEEMKIRQLQVMSYENNARANYHMDAMLHPEKQNVADVDGLYAYVDTLQHPTTVVTPTSSLEDRLNALEKQSLKLAKDA